MHIESRNEMLPQKQFKSCISLVLVEYQRKLMGGFARSCGFDFYIPNLTSGHDQKIRLRMLSSQNELAREGVWGHL